ncbi:MAG: DUF547 domain-containing protein [Spirulina sp. SIO3F2]|nr:DUF547 domain-containing protein [Spirulina sp. SIO3F2]
MFKSVFRPTTTLLLLPLCAAIVGCSGPAVSDTAPASDTAETSQTASAEPLNVDDLATVLKTYVDEQGLVDYVGLQGDRQDLDQFNDSLAAVTPEDYAAWSEADQIAFWINAYNSLTLKSIINQSPLKASIKDITGVWRIRKHKIVDGSKTLDNIEHQTLRVDFNEPRIHAALVCAAISCPKLRTEPFVGDRLDEQLDDQSRDFINSSQGLQIKPDEGTVYLSSIFQWFGDDWLKTYGVEDGFAGSASEKAVLNFVSQYVSDEDAAYLKAGDYKVKYLNYDWSLNLQS